MFEEFFKKIKIYILSKERLNNKIFWLERENEVLKKRIESSVQLLDNLEKLSANYIENNILMYNLHIAKETFLSFSKSNKINNSQP